MDVSILAKGSSLKTTWPKVGVGAVVVAVNDAITVEPNADWLVCLDADRFLWDRQPSVFQLLRKYPPRQGVFTASAHLPAVQAVWPDKVWVGSDRIERVGYHMMPCSGLAAVWFAHQVLGGTTLHLHGFDMQGKNYAGEEEKIERGNRRWPGEREILSGVCGALRTLGVTVHSYGAWKP